ncbi:O-antigen translocase [Mucilaginibacter galii]|uniref:O-antigen translocase n=1 Tax=Mucilaginibacter galii TaxID=2005073 RepID=A0A917JBB0_9SPHI|nr:O-antigen translocase [Mucilaginibacter galii]GGI51462.1 hypothetical protein GCM10011425_26740 [Mucilaginibacter galii]
MKLLKTSFFSAIITVVRIAAGFVANKAVAVFTGATGVATIGQFTNFIAIALTFANGAINNGVIKYTAEFDGDKDQLQKLFSTSFKISLYCSFLIGAVLLILSPYISNYLFSSEVYSMPIKVLGITIVLYSLNSLLISILNGKKQISSFTVINTAGSIIGLLFTVILVFYFKLQGAIYALVLAQSIVFFVTLAMILKSDWFQWSYFNQPFDRKVAVSLSHFSLMAIVTALTVPVSQIFLRNLIANKLGIDSAGYWQGMMRISDGYLLLITTSLGTYYLPKLSSLLLDKDLKNEILNGYKIIMPAVFVSCVIIYFMRFIIIRILYVESFINMQSLFFYQLLGDFFKIAAWLLGYLLVAKSMTKIYVITEIGFSVCYVVIGYFCIRSFGLVGITIAFAVSYFMYFLLMLMIFRKTLFN